MLFGYSASCPTPLVHTYIKRKNMRLTCRPFALLLVLLFSLNSAAQLSKEDVSDTKQLGGSVTVTAPTLTKSPGTTFNVALNASDTTGQGITGYDLSLDFDSTVIQYNGCTLVGTIFNSYPFSCNIFPAPNTIDVAVGGTTNTIGSGAIVIFSFTAVGPVGSVSPLNFSFFQFNEGDPADITVNGSITLFPTTAANSSVSGRVLTADGSAIRNARVVFTDSEGEVRSAVSNPFGYFVVEGLPAGRTYVVSTWSKGYNFDPVTLSIVEDMADFEIRSME
jgi:hypothetical protein